MNRAQIDVCNIVAKSEALTQITATIDPSLWSARKKNIILDALKHGLASCGRDTGAMIEELVAHCCGDSMPNINKGWHGGVDARYIRPEKFEDFMAYTCAWLRMKKATEKTVTSPRGYDRTVGGLNYQERRFLERVQEHGSSVAALTRGLQEHELRWGAGNVPLNPSMTHKEKGEFIREYIIEPDDDQTEKRAELARRIENNETITFTYYN